MNRDARRAKPTTAVCATCGETFTGLRKRKYCSDKCMYARKRPDEQLVRRRGYGARNRQLLKERSVEELLAATPSHKRCNCAEHGGLLVPSDMFFADATKKIPLSSRCKLQSAPVTTVQFPEYPKYTPVMHGPIGPEGKHPCSGPFHNGLRVWLDVAQFAPSQLNGGRCRACCSLAANGRLPVHGPLDVPGKRRCNGPLHDGEWLPESAFQPSKTRCRDCERPDKRRRERTRRARLSNAKTFKSVEKYIDTLYGKPCFFDCGNVADTHEHLVPLARGGDHSEGNIVPACLLCNSKKSAMLLVEFRRFLRNKGITVRF